MVTYYLSIRYPKISQHDASSCVAQVCDESGKTFGLRLLGAEVIIWTALKTCGPQARHLYDPAQDAVFPFALSSGPCLNRNELGSYLVIARSYAL